ncbi:hypothetical protein [Corynebacterium sanguinis]|uniref:hypothetical protein n=1 Tax=Corynebacterium sanguinis TaxID=2594913 RepID=UPI0021A78DAF|nr:hypothetical protein [Corynebacterium sanguinis]MCT1411641.1 hypothetical protein [Corynebacterium sanguinis]
MASIFRESVQQEIKDQPFWLRYKGSIIIVATGLVSILGQLATSPDLAGTQVAAILTVVVTVAGFILNRFTKDGLTPSMAQRLEQAGQRVFSNIPFETTPVTHVQVAAPEYVGEHRAPDSPTGDGLTDGEVARAQVEQAHRDATGA